MSDSGAGISRRGMLGGAAGAVAATAVAGTRALGAQPAKRRLALVGTGIRGTGMWGKRLLDQYGDVVEMVGLCDINPGRLEYARNYLGVTARTFGDFGEMLRTVEPEAVVVTTTDYTHDLMITEALDFGCDVIVEKPLTTDHQKLQGIIDACERNQRDITVTHNYRYSPHRQEMKELIERGRIGKLTSVDFHWYLDVYHGAAYFRRWHGKEKFSGGLWTHKCCHHFDLLNWWIDSDPEVVSANAAQEFYGEHGPFRHSNCRPCPHKNTCEFYWDISRSQRLVDLYVKNEHHDGYIRDGCVFSPENDIADKMSALIRYRNGVHATYSCTSYSPYEGYRIAFNGTEGRLEAWIKERQPWDTEPHDELRLTDNFGQTRLIQIPHASGGHGGGDSRMLDRIFRYPDRPDPYRQAASLRDGAMSVLIGFAARESARTAQAVEIGSLSSLEPRVERG